MIQCQICGRQLGNLTGKHLASHGISAEKYKVKYPGHPVTMPRVQSQETKDKRAAKLRGRKHSAETKSKIGARHKGKVRSQQEIDKWCESYQAFLEQNGGSPQKGYKRSQDFKDRMREVALKRDQDLVQQKVDQMNAARRGSKASTQQRENYRNGRLKWMQENPDKLPKVMFNTTPEVEFEDQLLKRNIPYTKSYHLGQRVFDFKIGDNCLVEIDGPYHRTLGFYIQLQAPVEDKIEKLRKFIERDRAKAWYARTHGYFVYRIPVGKHLPDNWYQILQDQGFTEF